MWAICVSKHRSSCQPSLEACEVNWRSVSSQYRSAGAQRGPTRSAGEEDLLEGVVGQIGGAVRPAGRPGVAHVDLWEHSAAQHSASAEHTQPRRVPWTDPRWHISISHSTLPNMHAVCAPVLGPRVSHDYTRARAAGCARGRGCVRGGAGGGRRAEVASRTSP